MKTKHEQYDFWMKCFAPRSKEWQESTLERLYSNQSIFETAEEREIKMDVLEDLLGK